MSTEVEQQQPTVAEQAVEKPSEENGNTAAEATGVPNGESKTEEKKNGVVKKEVEPPKDLKTETAGWVNQQHKTVVHQANYRILEWLINNVYSEDDKEKPTLPKSGFITRREFLNYLKDGVILARFANKFQPNAGETVKEGEEIKNKENQQANVNVFASVAKTYVPEEQVFSHEELEKGKEVYPKVFATLFQVMLKAPAEFFKHTGSDFDQFVKEISEVEPQKFWQKVLNNLNNIGNYINVIVRRPFVRNNSNAQTEQSEQNGVATNGVHTNGTTAEHEENGVSNGTKAEEKKEEVPSPAPVIAAN